jgi:hypothetical protein
MQRAHQQAAAAYIRYKKMTSITLGSDVQTCLTIRVASLSTASKMKQCMRGEGVLQIARRPSPFTFNGNNVGLDRMR